MKRSERPISLDQLLSQAPTLSPRARPQDPQLSHDPEEISRRFRRMWLRQVLFGPLLVVLLLAFLLARIYWGGVLNRVPWEALWIGFIVLDFGFAYANNRCPSCRSRLLSRRSLSLDFCPKCGVGFTLPKPEVTALPSARRHLRLSGGQRGNIALLTSILSFAIVLFSPLVVKASEASTRLAMAPPALFQSSQPATAIPLKLSTFTGPAFAFQYPADWQTGGADPTGNGDGTMLGATSLLDPDGATDSRGYLDYVEVVAVKLTHAVDQTTSFAHSQRQFEQSWVKTYGKVQLVEPWQDVSYGGLHGFRGTFTFSFRGQPVVKSETFLFQGDIEYEIAVRSVVANWLKDKPAFDQMDSSFRPLATD